MSVSICCFNLSVWFFEQYNDAHVYLRALLRRYVVNVILVERPISDCNRYLNCLFMRLFHKQGHGQFYNRVQFIRMVNLFYVCLILKLYLICYLQLSLVKINKIHCDLVQIFYQRSFPIFRFVSCSDFFFDILKAITRCF